MKTLTNEQFEVLNTKSRKSTYADVKKFLTSLNVAENKGKILEVDLMKDAKIEKIHYTTFLKLKREDKFNLVIAEKQTQYYVTKIAVKF